MYHFSTKKYSIIDFAKVPMSILFENTVTDGEAQFNAALCIELINIRDGNLKCSVNYDECTEMLRYLCTR